MFEELIARLAVREDNSALLPDTMTFFQFAMFIYYLYVFDRLTTNKYVKELFIRLVQRKTMMM